MEQSAAKKLVKIAHFPRLLVIRGVPGKEKGILKTQDARNIKSQSEALLLLRRFLIPLQLFLLLLFLFQLRRRLRMLLFGCCGFCVD
jgi:hypothetical protein